MVHEAKSAVKILSGSVGRRDLIPALLMSKSFFSPAKCFTGDSQEYKSLVETSELKCG
jgi:hypothetical protein